MVFASVLTHEVRKLFGQLALALDGSGHQRAIGVRHGPLHRDRVHRVGDRHRAAEQGGGKNEVTHDDSLYGTPLVPSSSMPQPTTQPMPPLTPITWPLM